jgi:hypothetical protein
VIVLILALLLMIGTRRTSVGAFDRTVRNTYEERVFQHLVNFYLFSLSGMDRNVGYRFIWCAFVAIASGVGLKLSAEAGEAWWCTGARVSGIVCGTCGTDSRVSILLLCLIGPVQLVTYSTLHPPKL